MPILLYSSLSSVQRQVPPALVTPDIGGYSWENSGSLLPVTSAMGWPWKSGQNIRVASVTMAHRKKIQYRYTTGQRDIITSSLNCCAHTITAILHRSYDAKCFMERKQGFHEGHSISDAGKISDTHSDLHIDAPVPISSGYSSFVNRNGHWATPRGSWRI